MIERHLTGADEENILRIAAPALLRLLRKREENARLRLYGQFRAGNTELLAYIAEWAAITDLITDTEQKLRERDSQKGN